MAGIVLVGVDGSDTAQKAAQRAASIAQGLGVGLAVVTAHATDNTEVVRIGRDTWVMDDAEQALKLAEHSAELLRQDYPGLEITPVAALGKPQDALVEEAERSGAQMIVVGNVGMKGLGRLLGSVATSVAHHAPCDVLIAKTS
ncbi:universal stress protein [Zafaria cholistanensis]|uniref:Universal stress protein n=1 Tax=Zafaria cholistanensis TaxID=1682741 RepID=A0A5A7NS37_9MICC|nr:universal stress protein [Zafaria cholistanensis]GER22922.1 universal stress protein [Zafaria cholistanensis]